MVRVRCLQNNMFHHYGRLKKIQNTYHFEFSTFMVKDRPVKVMSYQNSQKDCQKGLPPIIYGDGRHTRDFISVDDVTEAMLAALRAMEGSRYFNNKTFDSSTVFNLGTGIPYSIGQLAQKMIDMFRLDLEPIYKPLTDSGVILHSYADMTKAKELLHFVPKLGIDDGLREIVKTVNSSK